MRWQVLLMIGMLISSPLPSGFSPPLAVLGRVLAIRFPLLQQESQSNALPSNSFFVIPVAHFPWSVKGRENRSPTKTDRETV